MEDVTVGKIYKKEHYLYEKMQGHTYGDRLRRPILQDTPTYRQLERALKVSQEQNRDGFGETDNVLLYILPLMRIPDRHTYNFFRSSVSLSIMNLADKRLESTIMSTFNIGSPHINRHYIGGQASCYDGDQFGTVIPIDNVLHDFKSIRKCLPKKVFKKIDTQFPVDDVLLHQQHQHFSKEKSYSLIEHDRLKKQILESDKYVYGVFRIQEEWSLFDYDRNQHDIFYNQYDMVVQVFSEAWLTQNGLSKEHVQIASINLSPYIQGFDAGSLGDHGDGLDGEQLASDIRSYIYYDNIRQTTYETLFENTTRNARQFGSKKTLARLDFTSGQSFIEGLPDFKQDHPIFKDAYFGVSAMPVTINQIKHY